MHCANWVATLTTWVIRAFRRCALVAPCSTCVAPIRVRGDVSSQFLTALLMALPLVARDDVVIEVVGELISRPYIEITLNMLAQFGVNVVTRRLGSLHHPRPQPAALSG